MRQYFIVMCSQSTRRDWITDSVCYKMVSQSITADKIFTRPFDRGDVYMPTYSVNITYGTGRKVIVNNNTDAFEVDSSSHQFRTN